MTKKMYEFIVPIFFIGGLFWIFCIATPKKNLIINSEKVNSGRICKPISLTERWASIDNWIEKNSKMRNPKRVTFEN
jgi:hypothetical protein